VPLLGVLPGTGGLTRLSDKRRVRRDHADIFCTTAEGVKGQRALDWRLVDAIAPRSRFDGLVEDRVAQLAAAAPGKDGPGVPLPPLGVKAGENELAYTLLHVGIDRRARTATFRLHGPDGRPPEDALALRREGSGTWMLRLFRELDDAICRLRFNEEEIGVWLFKTEGDPDLVASHDAALSRLAPSDWFAREVLLLAGRVLRRMDVTARTLFALVEPGSCFAGCLLEISLACDRAYALDDPGRAVGLRLSPLNFGALPMGHGPARLQTRFLHRPESLAALRKRTGAGEPPRFDAKAAVEAGLLTIAADEIDYADEVRVAIEERSSLSPDALTGMEASLRFPGVESMESKIFGRLSAWQNWIFQRPNAVGEHGALKCYGKPERPAFDWRRT
ncbi:MAG: benzoyl-CoA-dihydrodiol lyase, partial [Acidobacteria bacterium]|nr:benzoyl-CoA-dihydrodiol lyase [Acidobacteriota bacterium]